MDTWRSGDFSIQIWCIPLEASLLKSFYIFICKFHWWYYERTNERTDGRTDGRTNGRTDEWTNERTNEETNKQTNKQTLTLSIISDDYCISSPCKNGGVCHPRHTQLLYHCNCPHGFTGRNCDGKSTYILFNKPLFYILSWKWMFHNNSQTIHLYYFNHKK